MGRNWSELLNICQNTMSNFINGLKDIRWTCLHKIFLVLSKNLKALSICQIRFLLFNHTDNDINK
jgi:hypothetical protein